MPISGLGIAFVVSGFSALQGLSQQPLIGSAPTSVPYKQVDSSKYPPLKACPADIKSLQEPDVIYKMAEGVTPPKPTQTVMVGLTKEGQQAYKHNLFRDPNEVFSKISIVVNIKGRPLSPCLQQSAGFDLDDQARNAVLQWRFQPAIKEGKPVAMRTTIEIRYETH